MNAPYIRLRRPAPQPCQHCGKAYDVRDVTRTRKFCSNACANTAKRNGKLKTCVKCKKSLPYESFVLRKNGTRPGSCTSCYTPGKIRTARADGTPIALAPNPCLECGEKFYVKGYKSDAKLRKFCSPSCQVKGKTKKIRQCIWCHQHKSCEDFGYQPSGKGRAHICEACQTERARLKQEKLGFMLSFGKMYQTAKTTAARCKTEYRLSQEDLAALHGSACSLCGAPSCVVRSLAPEAGFFPGGCDAICWACSQLTSPNSPRGFTDEQIIKQARAIVRYADS